MTTPRIIKKYPNRRLYDTETSSYITPAEVKDLVLGYKELQVPNAMGGYLEKGAKAVIDLQDELRTQALKMFSGFPYSAPGSDSAPEGEKTGATKSKAVRKSKAKK